MICYAQLRLSISDESLRERERLKLCRLPLSHTPFLFLHSRYRSALSMMARFTVMAVCMVMARGESWQDIAAAFFSDDDCQGSTESCALNALQIGRCITDYETEVKAPLMDMVKQLKDITNSLVTW